MLARSHSFPSRVGIRLGIRLGIRSHSLPSRSATSDYWDVIQVTLALAMLASCFCPPILSYCSQQHGVVMVHCSRLAARICGIRLDRQIISLQELLFGDRSPEVDQQCQHRGGQESVAANSFVTAFDANSTITIEDSEVGTPQNELSVYPCSLPVATPYDTNATITIQDCVIGTPINELCGHPDSADSGIELNDLSDLTKNGYPGSVQNGIGAPRNELNDLSDLSLNDDPGSVDNGIRAPRNELSDPSDNRLLVELDNDERELIARQRMTTDVMEKLCEQHARGEVSDDDLSAARAAIHESLSQLRSTLDRLAVTRARLKQAE